MNPDVAALLSTLDSDIERLSPDVSTTASAAILRPMYFVASQSEETYQGVNKVYNNTRMLKRSIDALSTQVHLLTQALAATNKTIEEMKLSPPREIQIKRPIESPNAKRPKHEDLDAVFELFDKDEPFTVEGLEEIYCDFPPSCIVESLGGDTWWGNGVVESRRRRKTEVEVIVRWSEDHVVTYNLTLEAPLCIRPKNE